MRPSRASRLTTERFLRRWGRAAVGLVADGATGTRFGAKRASEMHGLGHIIQLYNLASELCFITLINRQSTIKDGGSLVLRHPKFRPSWIHQWTYRIGPGCTCILYFHTCCWVLFTLHCYASCKCTGRLSIFVQLVSLCVKDRRQTAVFVLDDYRRT